MERTMLKNGLKYITFVQRRLFSPVLLKTVCLFIVLIFFAMLSIQIEEIKVDDITNNYGVDCAEHNRLKKSRKNDKELYRKFEDLVIIEEKTLNFTDTEVANLTEGTARLVKKKVDFIRRPLLNCMDANDEYLAYVIAKDYLIKPTIGKPYMLSFKERLEMSSDEQARDVMEMIYKNNLMNGFFVEAGAADCELSSSLPLEHNFGWTGILIEATPQYFHECKRVNRKAYLMNTCLGVERTPYFAKFNFESAGIDNHTDSKVMAGFGDNSANDRDASYIQCFPLEAILAAVRSPKVNLFILDIEGYELAVLRAIDWSKVDIEVLTVEVEHAGVFMKDSSPTIIEEFMKDKGYKRFKHRNRFHYATGEELDHLYVRNDVVDRYNVVQL